MTTVGIIFNFFIHWPRKTGNCKLLKKAVNDGIKIMPALPVMGIVGIFPLPEYISGYNLPS